MPERNNLLPFHTQIFSWLGMHRDHLPPKAVEELQEIADDIKATGEAVIARPPKVWDAICPFCKAAMRTSEDKSPYRNIDKYTCWTCGKESLLKVEYWLEDE